MMFSFLEIIYLLVLVLSVGFIFSGFIRRPETDPLKRLLTKHKLFDWKNIKYAMMVAAPAVVLHELAHKFVAIGFGLNADFFIWPTGIVIGVVLKLIGSGFILLAPGYVSIAGASGLQSAIISLAGPLMNAVLWIGSITYLKYKKDISKKNEGYLRIFSKLNKWLFIFNMIPIPPLDGSKILMYLIGLF